MLSNSARGRWLPVVLFAALIFIGSSIPGDKLELGFTIQDKIAHTCEYGIFAVLLARAFGRRWWWLAIVVGTLYGVSDEFHQTFTPNRSGNDLGDLCADFVGSTLGALAWVRLGGYLRRRRGDGNKTA